MSDIIQKIKNEVKDNWSKKRKPLLFSTIGGTFSEIKEEPGFTNVGSWINKNIDDLDAYVYTDKDRPEYIGLIPNGEVFDYKNTTSKHLLQPTGKFEPRKQKMVVDFLLAISVLDDDDVRRINIPTDILIKLMK